MGGWKRKAKEIISNDKIFKFNTAALEVYKNKRKKLCYDKRTKVRTKDSVRADYMEVSNEAGRWAELFVEMNLRLVLHVKNISSGKQTGFFV